MKVAIVGATGLVGKKIFEQLKDKNIELVLYASKRSKGKEICGQKVKVLSILSVKKVDFAIFSAGSEVSKKYAPIFAKRGAIVIDNSSAFRQDENIPLVVPEINFEKVSNKTKIIANPNCSTIQIVLVLFYLSQIAKIKRVVISTYQSASGAGEKGIFDLENETTLKIAQVLKDDLVAQIGNFANNGYSEEENKMIFEIQKILGKKINITATAVRVPIHFCHGASVNVEFEEQFNLQDVFDKLKNAKGVVLCDNLDKNIYPLCKNAVQSKNVFVGRIRRDFSVESGLNFWVVADNLYKGASTNAIQIMQEIINQGAKK